MKPSLSIIIPTHKRPEILRRCLEHIEKQTIVDQLEVIVVHDGHDEATSAKLRAASDWKFSLKYFEIEKSQQGVARNRGVEIANADLVLFIGDDIFLAPDACEKHLACLGERRRTMTSHQVPLVSARGETNRGDTEAVLGFTTWDPACGVTPVMQWLERSGWQFGYPMIQRYAHNIIPSAIQHRFTYTSHISVPTAIAKAHPFNEDVTLYGWEDMLWGTELQKAGVELMYEPDAKALHHHHIELADSLKRMETIGTSLRTIEKIDPTFDRIPRGWKLWAHKMMALLPTVRGMHERAFMRGLTE